MYFTIPLNVPNEVTEVKSCEKLLSCPILYCPTGPTYSVNNRWMIAETTNLIKITPAFKEVIFNNKFLFIKPGIFN